MKINLLIGAAVSLAVNSSIFWLGRHAPAHPRPMAIAVKQADQIKFDLSEDPPETVEDSGPQHEKSPDIAPPEQPDIPPAPNPEQTIIQPIQPSRPSVIHYNGPVIPENWSPRDGPSGPPIYPESELDLRPEAVVQVKPEYPFDMRRTGISGQVLVAFIVDTNGRVRDAYAARSTDRAFEQAAVNAVSKWTFKPGRKAGRSVNTHMEVPILFSIGADTN